MHLDEGIFDRDKYGASTSGLSLVYININIVYKKAHPFHVFFFFILNGKYRSHFTYHICFLRSIFFFVLLEPILCVTAEHKFLPYMLYHSVPYIYKQNKKTNTKSTCVLALVFFVCVVSHSSGCVLVIFVLFLSNRPIQLSLLDKRNKHLGGNKSATHSINRCKSFEFN